MQLLCVREKKSLLTYTVKKMKQEDLRSKFWYKKCCLSGIYTLELARQAVAAVLHPLSSQFFWRLHQQLESQQIPWNGGPSQQL